MILGVLSVFGAGLLAGAELVVRYGVRGPLASLDDEPHIRLRQALIRTLRVLVPAIYVPTLLTASGAAALAGIDAAFPLRCAAVLALLVWIGVTLVGTAPINAAALEWQPSAPPGDWRAQVDRWELLNSVRTWLAMAAFALLVLSVAVASVGK
jgi:uncharacterized membrane protein